MASPCGDTEPFTHGNSFSANTAALMKKGMNVSLMPWASSLGAHSFRNATIALMSHSSKQCVCAAVCLALIMFSAMTLRTRENGTVVSRGPEAAPPVAAGWRNEGSGAAVTGAAGRAAAGYPPEAGAGAVVVAAGALPRRLR